MSKSELERLKKIGMVLLMKKGNYKKALDFFSKALELDRKDASLWYYKGDTCLQIAAHQKKKEFLPKAQKFLEKSLELKPNHINTIFKLIAVQAGLKNTPKMIELFNLAKKINPNHPRVKKSEPLYEELETAREETIKSYEDLKDMAEKEGF